MNIKNHLNADQKELLKLIDDEIISIHSAFLSPEYLILNFTNGEKFQILLKSNGKVLPGAEKLVKDFFGLDGNPGGLMQNSRKVIMHIKQ
jgi:hypothetical protein